MCFLILFSSVVQVIYFSLYFEKKNNSEKQAGSMGWQYNYFLEMSSEIITEYQDEARKEQTILSVSLQREGYES